MIAEMQRQFHYFTKTHLKNGKIEESQQLYFDFHLWYRIDQITRAVQSVDRIFQHLVMN